jgi:acyl-CoA synthetase (AMP-forming)/AMP-acid ligase II
VRPFTDLFDTPATLSAESQARFDRVTPDTLANIQFTSGSTNLPKGVEVTHGMMVTNQVGIAQMWPFVDRNEVVVDWLPWNHTFGGNFVFNMMLMMYRHSKHDFGVTLSGSASGRPCLEQLGQRQAAKRGSRGRAGKSLGEGVAVSGAAVATAPDGLSNRAGEVRSYVADVCPDVCDRAG